ncbi:hypothetical protein CDL12_12510 [Handroanthus impetiginosus]|uniref:Uncharacterized protein n=1 Tax=Handroanthus impetiginosus TaxID=429701 RepID=A0A2G9HC33_9LAMI|nr:hypothetical protein CDL12_12510 [Handroanthus impetiginosus]
MELKRCNSHRILRSHGHDLFTEDLICNNPDQHSSFSYSIMQLLKLLAKNIHQSYSSAPKDHVWSVASGKGNNNEILFLLSRQMQVLHSLFLFIFPYVFVLLTKIQGPPITKSRYSFHFRSPLLLTKN